MLLNAVVYLQTWKVYKLCCFLALRIGTKLVDKRRYNSNAQNVNQTKAVQVSSEESVSNKWSQSVVFLRLQDALLYSPVYYNPGRRSWATFYCSQRSTACALNPISSFFRICPGCFSERHGISGSSKDGQRIAIEAHNWNCLRGGGK